MLTGVFYFYRRRKMKLANIKKELLNANLKHDEKKRVKFRKKMFEKIIEYKNRGKKFFAKHIL